MDSFHEQDHGRAYFGPGQKAMSGPSPEPFPGSPSSPVDHAPMPGPMPMDHAPGPGPGRHTLSAALHGGPRTKR